MALQDTARRLIDKFGRHDGVLRRSTTVDTPKPWAPEVSSAPVASGQTVVVLDAKTVLRPEQLLPEQTSVAYMDADVEPKGLDVLETAGQRYAVLEVEQLAPGETTYLYILHLKAS